MRESKKLCKNKDVSPPGDLIYSKDDYSIHEIDGEEHKVSINHANGHIHFSSKLICTFSYTRRISHSLLSYF